MKIENEKDLSRLYHSYASAREKHPNGFSANSEAKRARKEYLDAEVELLERLDGEDLEILNAMIEANCEYIDLISEEMFTLGGRAALGMEG